jgi:hypothetical protein
MKSWRPLWVEYGGSGSVPCTAVQGGKPTYVRRSNPFSTAFAATAMVCVAASCGFILPGISFTWPGRALFQTSCGAS